MLIPFSTLLPVAALAAVVAATSNVLEARQIVSTCTRGNNYCCNSLLPPSSTEVSELASETGADLSGVTGYLGVTCYSLQAGAYCSGLDVCCTGKNYKGRLVVACTPNLY